MTAVLTPEQLQALVIKVGGADQALRVVSGEVDLALSPTTALIDHIAVPSDATYEQRIAAGNFGWRHEGLTEKQFPVTPEQAGSYDLKRFHFNRSISSVHAIAEIREAGYEPAETGHIMAFGAASPDEQRRHPVIGLGSVQMVDGSLSVPALWFDGDRRTLDLIWYDGDWHRNYRFLGVRRSDEVGQ